MDKEKENILLIVRDRSTFFTIKEFLEGKGHKVLDVGISPLYFEEDTVAAIVIKVNQLAQTEKIDLILIDLFLKREEYELNENQELASIKLANDVLKSFVNFKFAFMTCQNMTNNVDFKNNCKNVKPEFLLIHRPSINKNISFIDGEGEYVECPHKADEHIKCQVASKNCILPNLQPRP